MRYYTAPGHYVFVVDFVEYVPKILREKPINWKTKF